MADEMFHDDIPSRVAEDLARMYESPVQVPRRLDDAILNRARARLAGATGRGWRALRLAGAAAAAACVLLVLRVTLFTKGVPDDIDGNRRVDIVDALVLARQIESGKGRDVNGDGALDHQDVDAIAMIAVRLDGGVQ